MAPLLALAVLSIVVLAVFNLYFPFLSGKIGENFVSSKLLSLDPKHYKILDDLLLPSQGNTNSTQIDHLVVSSYGLFVIETKNYKGWIFGNAYDEKWTQVIYRHKERFYNPVRQNFAHIKAVEALVRPAFPTVPIVGFVAFPSAGKLRVSGTESVGHARDIVRKIESYKSPILSDTQKNQILDALYAANIEDKKLRKEHIQDARTLKNSKQRF